MDTVTPPAPSTPASPRPAPIVSERRGAVAGVVAAVAALATGEVVTALDSDGPSLVTAVGDEFVDRFAASLKDLAVAIFGTNDKAALVVGIVVVSLLLGACLGAAAVHRFALAVVGFVAFGVVGLLSYLASPLGEPWVGWVASIAAVLVGVGTLRFLLHQARADAAHPAADPSPSPGEQVPAPESRTSRRRFVVSAASIAAGAVVVAGLSRSARAGDPSASVRRTTVVPRPVARRSLPASQPFDVSAITPYVTSNDEFFRIDTALSPPRVDTAGWRLGVTGMVERPFELTFDELLALDAVEEVVTLQCVSNEVGGDLVGNAVWQGVPLSVLLERAGVRPGATQLVGRSVDGWTAGFPTELAGDGRVAMVAYAMNGELLPVDHGFPARLVVSGLYGYVSATKWLAEIELTTWEAFDGYWVPRGWSKEGPVKIASRIDVPAQGDEVDAGPVAVGGVAWAPATGIAAVELQVDDGAWEPCELGVAASEHTWVQWHRVWDATPGEHVLRVRAVDAAGRVQVEEPSSPAPDGATGYHRRPIRVR